MTVSLRAGAFLAASCVLLVGCGGEQVPGDREARDIATRILAAYGDADAETICRLSSRVEREALADIARQLETRKSGCVAGTQEFFRGGSRQERAYFGLVPGPVTGVEQDGDAKVVTFQVRQFTRKEAAAIGFDDEETRGRQIPSRPIRVFREDGKLVVGF